MIYYLEIWNSSRFSIAILRSPKVDISSVISKEYRFYLLFIKPFSYKTIINSLLYLLTTQILAINLTFLVYQDNKGNAIKLISLEHRFSWIRCPSLHPKHLLFFQGFSPIILFGINRYTFLCLSPNITHNYFDMEYYKKKEESWIPTNNSRISQERIFINNSWKFVTLNKRILVTNIVQAVKKCYKIKIDYRDFWRFFYRFLQRKSSFFSFKASLHTKGTTFGEQRSLVCIAKKPWMEGKKTLFVIKTTVFWCENIIMFIRLFCKYLYVNNIGKTAQNSRF